MKRTDALRDVLHDMTRLYCGERVEVEFAKQPHYAGPDNGGPYLAVNPDVNGWYEPDPPVSGANELRLLRDTLSHEAYEYNMAHPDAKRAFMVRHGEVDDQHGTADAKAKYAGQIYNILRDAWVNTNRCSDFPGLRRTFAFKADLLAGEHDVSELDTVQALVTGLHQIALTNTANGVSDADDVVREALAWARSEVENARRADGHPELLAVAERVAERFLPHVEQTDNRNDLMNLLDDLDDVTMNVHTDDMSTQGVSNTINLADEPESEDVDLDLDDLEPADEDGDPDGQIEAEPEDLPDSLADDDASAEDADVNDWYDLPDDETEQADEDAESGASGAAGEDEGEDTDAGAGGAEDGDSGAEQGEDEGAPQGDGPSTKQAGDDTLDSLLDDMDTLDQSDRPAGDFLDLDDSDDYHEAADGDEDRFEQIQRRKQFGASDLGKRAKDRDDRHEVKAGDLESDEIRDLMTERGLCSDFREAFSQIKSREVTHTTRKPTTDLNLKNTVRHASGDYSVRDVYETTERGASGGRSILAVCDASQSMDSGGQFAYNSGGPGAVVDEKVTLAALAIATKEIGDDFMANAFDSYKQNSTALVTGPNESWDWDHLDAFGAVGGSTPLAAGVMDGVELFERDTGASDRVMLVLTDGAANSSLGGTKWAEHCTGKHAKEDARAAVEHARSEGITVIGVGIGNRVSTGDMRDMFGTDEHGEDLFIHVESDTLVEDVVRIYREQLDDDRVADVNI